MHTNGEKAWIVFYAQVCTHAISFEIKKYFHCPALLIDNSFLDGTSTLEQMLVPEHSGSTFTLYMRKIFAER